MEQVALQKLGNIVTPAQTAVVSFPAVSAAAAAAHGLDATSYIGLVQPPSFNASSLTAALPSAEGYTWVTADNTQFTGLAAATSDHASCCRFG